MSDLPQTPNELAWGLMGGLETLFWLEVASCYASRDEIRQKIHRRFTSAVE